MKRPGTEALFVAGFFALRLGVLAVNALAFPRLRPRLPHPARGAVSLLVPARDEAHNLARTLPGLLAQGAREVIVLDDGSQDGTADIARSLGATVLSGRELPPGWRGKPHACWQLAHAASGERLVFTDADVFWERGALDSVLWEWERQGSDLLTVWPRQKAYGLERLFVPSVDTVLLTAFPAPLARFPSALAAAGCGQLMAFRREAYWAVGGHRAVSRETLEDVRLAQQVKRCGRRLGLALGQGQIAVRMYRGARAAVPGLAKNLPPVHRHSPALLALHWGLLLALHRHPLAWLPSMLESLGVHWLSGRRRARDLAEVPLAPLLPLLTLPVWAAAIAGPGPWKGRPLGQNAGGGEGGQV